MFFLIKCNRIFGALFLSQNVMSQSLLRCVGIYSISLLATKTVAYIWAYKYKKQSCLLKKCLKNYNLNCLSVYFKSQK